MYHRQKFAGSMLESPICGAIMLLLKVDYHVSSPQTKVII